MSEQESSIAKRERIALWGALILIGIVALRPSIHGNDGIGNYVYLASLFGDGDLDFSDEYAHFDRIRDYPFKFSDLPRNQVTGLPTNRYGIGAALLWTPFVAAVHGGLLLAGAERPHLGSRPYEWAVGLATCFWGTLALALIHRHLRRRFGSLTCAAVLAALIFATPLGFYLYAHGSMSHGAGFFAATMLMLCFSRAWISPHWTTMAACGVSAGLLAVTRFQDVTWAALAGLLLAWRSFSFSERRSRAQPWLGLGAFVLGGIVPLAPQMAVWNILYGSWFSGPAPYLTGSAGQLSLWPKHFLEVLVSERGGALAWHPAMAIGLAGLCWLLRREPAWRATATLGLAGFVATTWLVAGWSVWWAGASFGNRFFISSLPFLALGMAPWFEFLPGRRGAAALAMLGLLIVWNLGLLVQYATEMIPREEAVPWSRVIRQNLIDVPKWGVGRLTRR